VELTIENITVRLRGREVLRGVTFRPQQGRVTVVLGPNGAGKSSLVRAAAGLVPPAEGRVMLDSQPVTALRPQVRAATIGYLPQDATVHWNIKARDLVALGRLPHRTSAAEHARAVDAALMATGTAALAGRPVRELSGGERARVLLARVLAGEPAWLLADEPLASLDPLHQIEMLEVLRGAAWWGRGVMVVLHDLIHAARVADAVLLLKDGAVLASGPPGDVLTPELLEQAYGVEVAMVDDGHGRLIPVPRQPALSI
jgi:iron complex transport system ATP-binding protein